MTKSRGSITRRGPEGQKQDIPIEEAPRVSRGRVVTQVGGSRATFSLPTVIGWIWGNRAHSPEDSRG